jgi:hypothetical protein
MQGTHRAELLGVPATGTRLPATGMDLLRVVNGTIEQIRIHAAAAKLRSRPATFQRPIGFSAPAAFATALGALYQWNTVANWSSASPRQASRRG